MLVILPHFTVLNNEVTLELREFAEKGVFIIYFCNSVCQVTCMQSCHLVADEEERATTYYLSITTIATFFSSVTATPLQFSYQQTSNLLGNAVNLVWFLSLVFSISCGVNSILSVTWRNRICEDYTTVLPIYLKHIFRKILDSRTTEIN